MSGDTMRFKSNDPIDKQITDKTLGFVKYHLYETKGHALTNIKIKWRKNLVELQGKRVAWISDSGEMKYDETVLDIKMVVETSLREWMEKRRLE